jgi:superfamily II DNA or RNA helicase
MPEVVLPWSRLSPGTLARVLGLDLALALLEAGWHLEAMRRSGASVRAQVELNLGRRGYATTTARGTATLELVLQPEGYSMASTCTCMAWSQPCLHVAALLLDLVADAPLRERLEHGEPVPADLGNPDARRAALQAELQVLQAVTVWSPPLAAGDAGPVELLVSVVDPRIDAARMELPDRDDPQLVLRFRRAHPRRVLDHTELDQLAPDDRALYELARKRPANRKGAVAVSPDAGVVLDMLRTRGRSASLDEPLRAPLRFGAPASLRVERAEAPGWLRISHAASRYSGFVSSPPPSQPFDAMVARWSADACGDAPGLDAPAWRVSLFPGPFAFVFAWDTGVFHPMAQGVDRAVAAMMQSHPAVPIPTGAAPRTWEMLARALRGRVRMPRPEAVGLPPREEPAFRLRVEGTALAVQVRLEANYPSRTVPVSPTMVLDATDDLRRDVDAERAWLAKVEAMGVPFDAEAGAFVAHDDVAVAFWSHGLPTLRAGAGAALEVLFAPGLERVVVRPAVRATARVQLVAGLLDADLSFTAGDQPADVEAMRAALRNKRRWFALDDGTLAEIGQEAAHLLAESDELAGAETDGGRVRAKLKVHQLGRLAAWGELGVAASVDDAVARLRERVRTLRFEGEAEIPKGLAATLRPYQVEGLAWLLFLHRLGVGGVLADDMGLGKTVTALGLLVWRRELDGPAPNLVVAPTSVASNWVREAARFAPGLRALLLHGGQRERDLAAIAGYDLVITTYALLRRDIELLKQVDFRTVIFDEAQQLKNAGAQTAQAARELASASALALTGTPVENRLAELWSIVDLVNPAMLGTLRSFQTRYERPVSADPRGPEAQRLRAMVRPFVLRRTKREVLDDLPPKEEIAREVMLTDKQRRQYDALARIVREEVQQKVAAQGLQRSGLAVLTALLRLRQMACDPRLVDPKSPADASGKREAFLELVEALVAEGRRALVFSQFVELLTLWRADLDARGVAYEYLDGSTVNRDAAVQRFQQGTAPLFLISLKAGGTGLNLTAADTVIHLDPWWNPAVEDQATDRAHRIGQQRAVTVYRLVAKGTVEEKIQTLKARKRELAEAVIAESVGPLQALTEDDLDALLGGVVSG